MMGRVALSAEQIEAIHAPGNLLIRAGAGSGKTEVLARRFVAHLAGDIGGGDPLAPGQIAAITFTEKATNDMRRRIRDVLDEQIADAADDPSRFARLKRVRQTLALARISTIHGFCARLLRENPLEAGIDPDFEVLDELESAAWLEHQCEELLIAAVKRGDPGARRLVATHNLRGASAYRFNAVELVMELTRGLSATGNDADWLRRATRKSAGELAGDASNVRALASELIGHVDALLASRNKKIRDQTADLSALWPRLRPSLESFDSNSPPEVLADLQLLADKFPKRRLAAIKPLMEPIAGLLWRNSASSIGLDGKLPAAYGSARAAQPMVEVAGLIAEIYGEIDQRARADRLLAFDGLLRMARDLLRREDIAARYRSTLGALLVDEYQDTDPIQDEIVRLLTEPQAGLPSPVLFIVGDEKQSIYRFRGADVTVFNRPREPVPASLPLIENRRSTPAIIGFVNALSADVMRTDKPAPYWVSWNDSHILKPLRPRVEGPAVELLLSAPHGADDKPDSRDLRIRESRALAAWIETARSTGMTVADRETENRRGVNYGDIAILFRSFTDVELYERALEERAIRFYTIKGRGFFGCSEVVDITSILAAVDDPDDALSLAAALRSPLIGLSDQCLLELAYQAGANRTSIVRLFAEPSHDFSRLRCEAAEAAGARDLIAELREARVRLPIAALTELVLERTGYEAVMLGQTRGPQRAANIRKLVEIGRRFDEAGLFTLTDFVNHLRRLADYEPREAQAQILDEGEDVVRLTTIHQAKGLEFPIVILADLSRGRPNLTSRHVISPRRGLVMCDTAGSGHDELPNRLLKEFREEESDQERAELARLLYVAMTRARDRLILSEGAVPRHGTWAHQIREFIGTGAIDRFLDSAAAAHPVNARGVEIMLRRAAAEPARQDARIHRDGDGPALAQLARERLSYQPAAPAEIVASPTELADFNRCPRAYLFRYELGMPEAPFFGSTGGSAIEMGLVAHAVLDEIGAPYPTDRPPEKIRDIVNRHAIGFGLDAAHREELAADLEQYVAKLQAETPAADTDVIGREVPFFVRIHDNGITLYIRGRIDLIVKRGGVVTVRDYKYARHVHSDRDAYQIQMETYALAAGSRYPADRIAAELLFIRGGTSAVAVELPPASESGRRVTGLARRLIEARRSRDFPMGPSSPDTCRVLGCGYIARCWKGGERGWKI